MATAKRIIAVYCLECGAESEISEERLNRGLVRCDAELDEGGLCYGPLMEYTPEPKQARQRGQG